jgi:hypothetical protein
MISLPVKLHLLGEKRIAVCVENRPEYSPGGILLTQEKQKFGRPAIVVETTSDVNSVKIGDVISVNLSKFKYCKLTGWSEFLLSSYNIEIYIGDECEIDAVYET